VTEREDQSIEFMTMKLREMIWARRHLRSELREYNVTPPMFRTELEEHLRDRAITMIGQLKAHIHDGITLLRVHQRGEDAYRPAERGSGQEQ